MHTRFAPIDFAAVRELVPVPWALRHYCGWQHTSAEPAGLRGPCPFCGGDHRSRRLHATQRVWYCHRCARGGDATELVRRLTGCTPVEAALTLCRDYGVTVPRRQ